VHQNDFAISNTSEWRSSWRRLFLASTIGWKEEYPSLFIYQLLQRIIFSSVACHAQFPSFHFPE